jgi:hypothetical protein
MTTEQPSQRSEQRQGEEDWRTGAGEPGRPRLLKHWKLAAAILIGLAALWFLA